METGGTEMRKGHLHARLYLGNRIEVVATNSDKGRLVVLLSSRLERERPGAFGDIVDTHLGEIVYRCCRTSY